MFYRLEIAGCPRVLFLRSFVLGMLMVLSMGCAAPASDPIYSDRGYTVEVDGDEGNVLEPDRDVDDDRELTQEELFDVYIYKIRELDEHLPGHYFDKCTEVVYDWCPCDPSRIEEICCAGTAHAFQCKTLGVLTDVYVWQEFWDCICGDESCGPLPENEPACLGYE